VLAWAVVHTPLQTYPQSETKLHKPSLVRQPRVPALLRELPSLVQNRPPSPPLNSSSRKLELAGFSKRRGTDDCTSARETERSVANQMLALKSSASWAVATAWDGSASFACALPVWCASAERLAGPRGGHVVLLSQNRSADCSPRVQTLWDDETALAAAGYSRRRGLPADAAISLAKCWMVFGLTQFAVVLFADLDVDVAPAAYSPPSPRRWSLLLAGFRRLPGVHFVASPEHSSPINSGVFLAKPNATLRGIGLHCLRRCRWSADDGFDGAGSARAVARGASLARQLGRGSGLVPRLTQYTHSPRHGVHSLY
jgi:hypothetical protein